jgi:hypothetical protein
MTSQEDLLKEVREGLRGKPPAMSEDEAVRRVEAIASLVLTHNVTAPGIWEEGEICRQTIFENYLLTRWKGLLLTGAADIIGVKGFNEIVPGDRRGDCVLIGRKTSILATKEIYLYLTLVVDSLTRPHRSKGRAFTNSFRFESASRLKEGLTESRKILTPPLAAQHTHEMEAIAHYSWFGGEP